MFSRRTLVPLIERRLSECSAAAKSWKDEVKDPMIQETEEGGWQQDTSCLLGIRSIASG